MGTEVLRNYVIGIIVFVIFVGSGVSLVSLMDDGVGNFEKNEKFDEFNSTFNKLDDVTAEVGVLRSNIEDADTDFGTFGALNGLIANSWQGLKVLIKSFDFMDDVFAGLFEVFGVPSWITGLLSLIIVVVFVFTIYEVIFAK